MSVPLRSLTLAWLSELELQRVPEVGQAKWVRVVVGYGANPKEEIVSQFVSEMRCKYPELWAAFIAKRRILEGKR